MTNELIVERSRVPTRDRRKLAARRQMKRRRRRGGAGDGRGVRVQVPILSFLIFISYFYVRPVNIELCVCGQNVKTGPV